MNLGKYILWLIKKVYQYFMKPPCNPLPGKVPNKQQGLHWCKVHTVYVCACVCVCVCVCVRVRVRVRVYVCVYVRVAMTGLNVGDCVRLVSLLSLSLSLML